MAIKLSEEVLKRLIQSIKRYFREDLEDEIGDLKALLLLEFCLKEIGPSIYNQAILDAQSYMQDRVTDLDGSCFEPEFSYWDEGLKPLKFDVFGRSVSVEKSDRGWTVFYLGDEGKKRTAKDIPIPSHLSEAEIEQHLADLCHEWATPTHPRVSRLQ